MNQPAISIQYEYTDAGNLHLWALAQADEPVSEECQLKLSITSRQTGRILMEDVVAGELPLRCDLDGVDVSEAFENGGSFVAVATLSGNSGSKNATDDPGGRGTLEIRVLGWKEALNLAFSYGLSLSGDFQNNPRGMLKDIALSLSAREGYKILGDPANIKLKYSVLGASPQAHTGQHTYKDGSIRFSDVSLKVASSGDTWMEFRLQVKVGMIGPGDSGALAVSNPINIVINTRCGK